MIKDILRSNRLVPGFLVLLTLLNLAQAFFSELILDESYYWYFSQDLSWGYFDHPPMVAFFVWLGGLFFEGELGVRFFAAFLFSGTVWFLWQCIDQKEKQQNQLLFCIFTASVALLNVYGFFMIPDTPLLFFAALFLWGYKRFLKTKDWGAVLILAICMAAMMYSKYHAVLLIGFILLSHPKLLLNVRFLAAAMIALVFYIPHLYWLYENDFVSIKYHLFDRADSRYKPAFTIEYLIGFLVIPGLTFPWIFKALFKTRFTDTFTRGLLFVVYGIFLFFLFSSFNRRTQAQWPVLVLLPMVIITFRYALAHLSFKKWLLRASIVSLVILSFLRIAVVSEELSPITYETHGNKNWVSEVISLSRGLPVVFRNSYTEASMLMFYTGRASFSLNGYPFRPNQFDLDSTENEFRHKKVVYMSNRYDADSTFGYTRTFRKQIWRGIVIDSFVSWRKLKLTLDEPSIHSQTNTLSFEVYNPYSEPVPISDLYFYGLTMNKKKKPQDTLPIKLSEIEKKGIITPGDILRLTAQLKNTDKIKGAAFFRVCISEKDILPFGFQGNVIPVKN